MKPRIRPVSIKDASKFVAEHHRHHEPPQGAKFCICAMFDGRIVGVGMVGRPVARETDQLFKKDVYVAEIIRVAAIPNLRHENGHALSICSMLYVRCKRICQLMGYDEIETKILKSEPGTSVAAAGFEDGGISAGGSWSRPSRGRTDKHPTGPKRKFSVSLSPTHPQPTEGATSPSDPRVKAATEGTR